MNNLRTEFRRLFVLKNLPENVKTNDEHWQITDNYLENTSLKLRKIRQPKTKQSTFILQQTVINQGFSEFNFTEIFLTESEYKNFFSNLTSHELRFNRYFVENFTIDVFLGNQFRGLILATSRFTDKKAMQSFQKPSFAVSEVSNNPNFIENNLLKTTFAELCNEINSK